MATLILNGNNVTTIENRIFHINGSITIMENAGLILENVWINFTQPSSELLLKGYASLTVEKSI